MTDPRERPIIFSGPMVRAILEGRKSQTRRVLKPQPDQDASTHWRESWGVWRNTTTHPGVRWRCPYGQPGDRLWVRETWLEFDRDHRHEPGPRDRLLDIGRPVRNGVAYRADTDSEGDAIRKEYGYKWRPSIHMPRWASRLTLEVTGVRVERVQEISETDARSEGVHPERETRVNGRHLAVDGYPGRLEAGNLHRIAFVRLWDSIHARLGHPWEANDWVWVVEFRRLEDA